MFSTENPQKFIKYLKKIERLRVFVSNDVVSLCSLKILTVVLSKEFIKHEIIFTDTLKDLSHLTDSDINLNGEYLYITNLSEISDKENLKVDNFECEIHNKLIYNNLRIVYGSELCSCKCNKMDLLISMYKLIKSINSLDENSLWAFLVGFEFYKIYLFKETVKDTEESDSEEEYRSSNFLCTECSDIFNTVCLDMKNLYGSTRDGIFFEKSLGFPLLKYSNIFHSLKNDIFFISKYKLIYKKRKDLEDIKIKGFLAKKGISLVKSYEKFENLDHSSKNYIKKNIEKSYTFVRKMGHTFKMSAIDCYFLMCYNIFNKKSIKGYLLLDKLKYNKSDKYIEFYKDIMTIIKESISNVSKIQKLLIFKIPKDKFLSITSYIKFVYNIISIYIREKFSKYDFIIIIDKYEDNKVLVCGYNVIIKKEVVNGIQIFIRREFYKNLVN